MLICTPNTGSDIFSYLTFFLSFQLFISFQSSMVLIGSLCLPCQALRQMEQENAKILNAKGELNEENASSYEKLRKSYDHLYRNVSS